MEKLEEALKKAADDDEAGLPSPLVPAAAALAREIESEVQSRCHSDGGNYA